MPALKKYAPWAVIALLAAMAMGCGATGFYSVRPGDEAAVRTFGKAREQTVSQEGLHWHWPSPIGKVDVWQTGKNRTAEIGYFTLPEGRSSIMTGENWEGDLQAATMITGDLNPVEVQAVAQYRISEGKRWGCATSTRPWYPKENRSKPKPWPKPSKSWTGGRPASP